jgi:hypothetical protein
MRRLGALAAAAVLVGLAAPATADDKTDTPVSSTAIEQKLATRNAQRDEALDARAAAVASALSAKAADASREQQERHVEDGQQAQGFRDDQASARRGAWRKTGAWFALPGAALVALGAFAWTTQAGKQSAITSGGFATGSDIGGAASDINIYQATSITAFSVGGPLLLTGLGLFLFGPAGVTTEVGSLHLRGAGFAW